MSALFIFFPMTAHTDMIHFLCADVDYLLLFSVLVHSGGVHGGHYYAFIRPTLSDQWCVFISWVSVLSGVFWYYMFYLFYTTPLYFECGLTFLSLRTKL